MTHGHGGHGGHGATGGAGPGGHVIEVRESTARVRVLLDGTVLADTRRPRILLETGYPERYYLPPEDVRTELLTPTETSTHCPFKGDASYWTVRGTDAVDVVWAYPEPKEDVAGIKDHLCFHAERPGLTLEVTEVGEGAGGQEG